MKFDAKQLDAANEVMSVAVGFGITQLGASLKQRVVRRDLSCEAYDPEMLRMSLSQALGTSGDVFMQPVVGQLGGSLSVFFKRNSAHKSANLAKGLPVDDISLSVDAGRHEATRLASGCLDAIAPRLATALGLSFEREAMQHATCPAAAELLATTFPPALSRRSREFVLIAHPFMAMEGVISGAVIAIVDGAGFLPMLRASRLAA